MENDFVPASLGWQHPMPDGVIPSPGRTGVKLDYVMCNSFGFGGNDSSLILSKSQPLADEQPLLDESRIHVAAQSTVSSEEEISGLREFLPPMETRRMSKMMKASLLSAFTALREAGIERPDAIIAATAKGMLELSTIFLEDIVNNQEQQLKPTVFMQSTHNTIASAIAILAVDWIKFDHFLATVAAATSTTSATASTAAWHSLQRGLSLRLSLAYT